MKFAMAFLMAVILPGLAQGQAEVTARPKTETIPGIPKLYQLELPRGWMMIDVPSRGVHVSALLPPGTSNPPKSGEPVLMIHQVLGSSETGDLNERANRFVAAFAPPDAPLEVRSQRLESPAQTSTLAAPTTLEAAQSEVAPPIQRRIILESQTGSTTQTRTGDGRSSTRRVAFTHSIVQRGQDYLYVYFFADEEAATGYSTDIAAILDSIRWK